MPLIPAVSEGTIEAATVATDAGAFELPAATAAIPARQLLPDAPPANSPPLVLSLPFPGFAALREAIR